MLVAPRWRLVAIVAIVVGASGAAACDFDDGRTLDPPVFPPPATTIATTTVPAEEIIATTAPPVAPFQLVAPWPNGATLPDRYTCFGDGVYPALSWVSVPLGTAELALTLTDLDAGAAVLWLVDAIPASTSGVIEGELPDLAFERANSSGETGYEAPCPPAGETNAYQFTLHALGQQLEVGDDAGADEVIAQLNRVAISQTSISAFVTGT